MRPCGECGDDRGCGCFARRRWLIAVEAGNELLRDLAAQREAETKAEEAATAASGDEIGEVAATLARAG